MSTSLVKSKFRKHKPTALTPYPPRARCPACSGIGFDVYTNLETGNTHARYCPRCSGSGRVAAGPTLATDGKMAAANDSAEVAL